MKNFSALVFLCVSFASIAQLRVGDPGVTFDLSKMDPSYPQMQKWMTAGVRGGIPFLEDQEIKATLQDGADSDDIITAINAVAGQGGGAILLENGNYRIDKGISMRANVSLIGESREGVICTVYMESASAFFFGSGDRNCGIYRMTIQGSWGEPQYDWNMSIPENDELPGNDNILVKFSGSEDCWLDGVNLLNCARDPMRCNAKHTTFRNLYVKGAHRKAGGAQGYFFLQDGYNLVTDCYMTHLRHFSLQGGGVEYNVVYDNDIEQEISFHSGDDGNNLIENNRITLPADMPPGTSSPKPDYFAIMGAWSIQHTNSADTNYILNNLIVEHNHPGSPTPWSEPNVLYVGPHVVKPANPLTNFTAEPNHRTPKGGTLYPIQLGTPAHVLLPAKIEAEDYVAQQGIQTETTTDDGGGQNVGNIHSGDALVYAIETSVATAFEFSARVASNTQGGTISVLLDGTETGEVATAGTGGWQQWETVSSTMVVPEGKHELTLRFEGGAGFLMNVNWIEWKEVSVTGVNHLEQVIQAFPNPTTGMVYLPSNSPRDKWVVSTLQGVVLREGIGCYMDLSDLPAGLYCLGLPVGTQVLRKE